MLLSRRHCIVIGNPSIQLYVFQETQLLNHFAAATEVGVKTATAAGAARVRNIVEAVQFLSIFHLATRSTNREKHRSKTGKIVSIT